MNGEFIGFGSKELCMSRRRGDDRSKGDGTWCKAGNQMKQITLFGWAVLGEEGEMVTPLGKIGPEYKEAQKIDLNVVVKYSQLLGIGPNQRKKIYFP